MNYIKELNAFHTQILFNPLSSSAVALWYALMHFNNKSGWRMEFTVAASQLQSHSGLKLSSFKRAREELVTKGHVVVTPQSGNQAPKYRMVSQQQSFEEVITDSGPSGSTQTKANTRVEQTAPASVQQTSQNDTMQVHTPSHTTDHNVDHTTGPLFKQEDTQEKQTHTCTPADQHDHQAVQFYKAHFGMPSERTLSDITTWINDTNDELVIHALTLALERDKTTWAYVKGILKAWSEKKITTVAEALQEAAAFATKHQRYKPRSHYATSSIRKEVVPDWFREQQQREAEAAVQAPEPSFDSDPDKTREELQRMLDEFCQKPGYRRAPVQQR